MVEREHARCSGATEWLEETRSACLGARSADPAAGQRLYCNGDAPCVQPCSAADLSAGVNALPHAAQNRLAGGFAALHFEQSVPARNASR